MNNILITEKLDGYELIDSGDGYKLERFGDRVLSRPDPQAIWPKSLSEEEWSRADAVFTRTDKTGKWKKSDSLSEEWRVVIGGLDFSLKLLPSKHVGVFPEQIQNWNWLSDKIKSSSKNVSVLNLFAYTGGATVACARAGASVCHVDASSFVVDYAGNNLRNSELGDKPVRFIVDDVRKFVEREIKRGNKYDIIIMDPPVYGKGTKGEEWNIEKDLPKLLSRAKELFSENPIAFVLNGYASGYSHITYKQMLSLIQGSFGGTVSSGELVIKDSTGKLLPAGIFSRWEK